MNLCWTPSPLPPPLIIKICQWGPWDDNVLLDINLLSRIPSVFCSQNKSNIENNKSNIIYPFVEIKYIKNFKIEVIIVINNYVIYMLHIICFPILKQL